MFGASLNEVGLVALFLCIVLLASKVGKLGEMVGGLFEPKVPAASGGGEPKAGEDQAARRGDSEGVKNR